MIGSEHFRKNRSITNDWDSSQKRIGEYNQGKRFGKNTIIDSSFNLTGFQRLRNGKLKSQTMTEMSNTYQGKTTQLKGWNERAFYDEFDNIVRARNALAPNWSTFLEEC